MSFKVNWNVGEPNHPAEHNLIGVRLNSACNALDYGIVGDGSTNNTAAIASFLALVGSKTAYFPAGTYICNIALSGLSCQIRGDGDRTIFKAPSGSTIPTFDMTGYVTASQTRANRLFENFAVEHDGTAGASKKGILAPNLSGLIFRNISIKNTGGACMDISNLQLSSLENIILNTPVNAKANDVPYLYGEGAVNGNRFIGLALRSTLSDSDVGVSGAVVLVDDDTWCPQSNVFYGTWVEFLHVPSGGAIFYFEATTQTISDTQFFDSSKENGATNTAHFRFGLPTFPGAGGGNIVNGYIPGHETAPETLDYGVDMLQSGNRVVGLKGYKGANVILRSGVQHTYVELGGSNSSSTDAAVIDNSGQTNNVIFDHYLRTQQLIVNEYADNAAAITAGLTTGMTYRTGDLLKVVH